MRSNHRRHQCGALFQQEKKLNQNVKVAQTTNSTIAEVSAACSHQWEGDEAQSREGQADFDGFGEPLGPVDVETQGGGAHDPKQDKQNHAESSKVLQTVDTFAASEPARSLNQLR